MEHTSTLPTPVRAPLFFEGADAPLVITGYQLQDALGLIAPDSTAKQLATALCIQPGPARKTLHGIEPAGLFCWLHDFPEEGSVRLDESPRSGSTPAAPDTQVVAVVHKLIEAARWVYSNADARRQPEARALAKAVLRLTTPLVDRHINAVCSHTTEPKAT